MAWERRGRGFYMEHVLRSAVWSSRSSPIRDCTTLVYRAKMVEFVVEGTPRSLQASVRGKAAWMDTVKLAAEAAMARGGERMDWVDVSIRILHFCFDWSPTGGDLDNIAKPIIDAICLVVFFNDNQAKQILLRRTDLLSAKITEVIGATPLLARRIDQALSSKDGGGFVHVSVDTGIDHGRLL